MVILELYQSNYSKDLVVFDSLEEGRSFVSKIHGYTLEKEDQLEYEYFNPKNIPDYTELIYNGNIVPFSRFMFDSEENVEIEGTEPYIVGGHTASGYWVDNNRETTIHGLFAAGDVAGGCPQKYVTGALAEGEIAAQAIAERLEGSGKGFVVNEVADSELSENAFAKKSEYERFLNNKQGLVDIEQTEEAMQKIMDQYAGGISTDYQYNEARLELADEKIKFLEQSIDNLAAQDADDLLRIYEIRERLTVCRSVIAHLKARKETRWHSFAENMDYPAKSDDWLKYVNSRKENGEIKIIIRDLVRGGDSYEHSDK